MVYDVLIFFGILIIFLGGFFAFFKLLTTSLNSKDADLIDSKPPQFEIEKKK